MEMLRPFGLMSSATEPTTLLSGRAVTLPTSNQVMAVVVEGNTVNVTLSYAAGTYRYWRRHLNFSGHVCWFGDRYNDEFVRQDCTSRIWPLHRFRCTRHCGRGFGFKVSDYLITVDGDETWLRELTAKLFL